MRGNLGVKEKLTFILGCTACGKSAIAFELAKRAGAEIVSIDSMKVYRLMNIGTAKPTAEKRALIRYHLLDVVEPYDEFNVAKYVTLAEEAIELIGRRANPIFVVGGTALYIKGLSQGLFEGPGEDLDFRVRLRQRASAEGTPVLHEELKQVDPIAAERIHPNDYRRIERALEVYFSGGTPISQLQTQWESKPLRYACRFVGLRRDREEQNRRINSRVKRMMEAGLLDEVKRLLADGRPLSRQASQAVGYAELIEHLQGGLALNDAVERIKINSRQLAKHQRTWFRRFPDVEWFDIAADEQTEAVVDRVQEWYDAQP